MKTGRYAAPAVKWLISLPQSQLGWGASFKAKFDLQSTYSWEMLTKTEANYIKAQDCFLIYLL